ncbi:alpha/beta fold hydrolase [Xanthomonas euvesicatoria]|uniref:alpha/beta fold hydrolase n=1 Tax=Xanthomonas citri TaxID=346 RepID=UPI000F80D250|nr:alpha/beta fold hydrolase [Xanthomonas axonopodis]MEE5092095.1 alpha/beta fold hydrolase [Xanthomonas euvesicatoria]RTE55727.1 alpha/beta fold hydrolase [Xanthomonas axonopodis pv. eucalyptorum]
MADGKSIEVDGVKVHYHDVGTGPALVLLHGSGPGASGYSNYVRNIEPLAEKFRVICPDLPGFGKSDMKPVSVPIPGWWTNIIVGLLEKLGIEKAHFIGNSMGGMITLKLALEQPQRVDRMILMGPGGGFPVSSVFRTEGIKTLAGFYDGPGPSLERLKSFIGQMLYDPSALTDDLLQQRLEAALDPRIVAQPPMRPGPAGMPEELWRDARLTKLPHETLIIWGREDRVLPLDTGFVLMKQIPRARFLVMPQCGHWVQWEHADEFNRTVASFLST